jgi:CubicO group peptidase (beta-lactamase class C family)
LPSSAKPNLEEAFAVLRKAVDNWIFPGAAAAVTHKGQLLALRGVGRFTYAPDSPAVVEGTVFDLASVTKVVATTTMAMILHERGRFKLEMPLAEVVPEFAEVVPDDAQRRQVTLRMLLAHSSGLPGYIRLFEQAEGKAAILRAACGVQLTAAPGTRAEYSDIGFILLGETLERLSGESLDTFCHREVFGPLGMTRTGFCPPAEWREGIPPTEEDPSYRRRVIQGEVQDENASAMGGVAGHAGVFAPAADVARFALCMLNGGEPLVRAETLELFTRRDSSVADTSRALGWDTPSHPSSSGKYFSERAYGHLGYAGTSLWIDPERELSVVLLTNRTWPDRSSQAIRQVRPRFHDAVVEALL